MSLLRPDGSVVIPATVAPEVLRALVRDLTARVRADGGEVGPGIRRVLWALHTAAQRADDPLGAGSRDGTPERCPVSVEVDTGTAAARLGCSAEYARRLARTGRLKARRVGRVWLVDQHSLENFGRDDAQAS